MLLFLCVHYDDYTMTTEKVACVNTLDIAIGRL